MNYRIVDPLAYEDFDRFARSHPLANLLQSAPWADVKAEWLCRRIGLQDGDGKLVAAAQILLRPTLPHLYFAYLPHGPLLDYSLPGLLEAFLDALRETARKQAYLCLRIHPPVAVREGSIAAFRAGEAREGLPLADLSARFAASGFQLQPRGLSMADTIQPRFEAKLRRENWEEPPRGKLRYNLKLCERYQLSVSRYSGAAAEDKLDAFAELIRMTEKRQGIRLRDREYFSRLLQAYGEDAALFFADFDLRRALTDTRARRASLLAEIEACREERPRKLKGLEEQRLSAEKDLAFYESLEKEGLAEQRHPSAVFAIRYGRAAEMPYAASDERFSRLPAVWALYTEGARWAFSGGSLSYNLGGLEGRLDDGLTTFKSHFDPVIEESAGEYDYSPRPTLYKCFKKALALRRSRLA